MSRSSGFGKYIFIGILLLIIYFLYNRGSQAQSSAEAVKQQYRDKKNPGSLYESFLRFIYGNIF